MSRRPMTYFDASVVGDPTVFARIQGAGCLAIFIYM